MFCERLLRACKQDQLAETISSLFAEVDCVSLIARKERAKGYLLAEVINLLDKAWSQMKHIIEKRVIDGTEINTNNGVLRCSSLS